MSVTTYRFLTDSEYYTMISSLVEIPTDQIDAYSAANPSSILYLYKFPNEATNIPAHYYYSKNDSSTENGSGGGDNTGVNSGNNSNVKNDNIKIANEIAEGLLVVGLGIGLLSGSWIVFAFAGLALLLINLFKDSISTVTETVKKVTDFVAKQPPVVKGIMILIVIAGAFFIYEFIKRI